MFGGNMDRPSRWILAIGLWGCGLFLARYGYAKLEFSWFVPAVILAFAGLFLVLRDCIQLAAMPFVALVNSIVFPRTRSSRPTPNYQLAEFYVEEERYDEAEIEYRTIIRYHRRELRAYLGLIELLVFLGRSREAAAVLRSARRHLRRDLEALNDLETKWIDLCAHEAPVR